MSRKRTPNIRGTPVGDEGPVNSIRMDAGRLEQFLTERDGQPQNTEAALKRGFMRWPFRKAAVTMTVLHRGGAPTRFMVACRNLSSGGIGVLHSAYVHPGVRCTVELTDAQGVSRSLEGWVVRCIHVQGTIHEVGIKFNGPIDPRRFLDLDPFADSFSLEAINAAELHGILLYIEDSTLDQAMVRHFLRETQIELLVAATAAEAVANATTGVDLILCADSAGSLGATETVRKLRESGFTQPILIITADTSSETRAKLIGAQANGFITKPLKQSTFFRAVGEFMMLNSAGTGAHSTLPEDHPNLGLLDTFVKEIREYARQIEEAMAAADAAKVRGLCIQIKGSAPVMGFEKLAQLAEAAEKALAVAGNCADAAVPIKTLIAACQRASKRAAAAA